MTLVESSTPNAAPRDSGIAGLFFHRLDPDWLADGKRVVQYQGHVREQLEGGFFLVEYFDFLTGSKTWGMQIHQLSETTEGRWRFYSSDEDMRDANEYGGFYQPEPDEHPADGDGVSFFFPNDS